MTRVSILPYEEDEQIAFVEWCRANNILVHHSGNEIGGSTRALKARALKMKRMGTSKGFPDLLVFIPIIGVTGEPDAYQACAIEMKRRKGGTVTKEQKKWLETLQASGLMCAVCHGADEAIAYVEAIRKEIQYDRFEEKFGDLTVGEALELNKAAKWSCGFEITSEAGDEL